MEANEKNFEEQRRIVEIAMHDRALISAKIFRPMGRGISSKIDDERRTEDTVTVTDPRLGAISVKVVAPYPVGAREEDILLVLLGLAAHEENTTRHGSRSLSVDSPEHLEIASQMEIKGDCLPCTLHQVRVSPYTLLSELSRGDYNPSKPAYDQLRPRLERLSWIGYSAKGMAGNREWEEGGSRFLHYRYIRGEDKDKTIVITFNERISRIMLGYVDADEPDKKPRRWFAKINLRERFALKSDVARMLHRLFSVWINEPQKNASKRRKSKGFGTSDEAFPVRVDTLISHIYGPKPVGETTLRSRRDHVRKALIEVTQLESWSIEMDREKTTAYVRRLFLPNKLAGEMVPL